MLSRMGSGTTPIEAFLINSRLNGILISHREGSSQNVVSIFDGKIHCSKVAVHVSFESSAPKKVAAGILCLKSVKVAIAFVWPPNPSEGDSFMERETRTFRKGPY